MILLGALIVGITFVYLSEVPLSQTGLYAIFCQPELSGIAREKSLKLLESVPLKYAYSLMVSSLAPLFAVMLFFGLRKTIKRRQIVFIFFYAVFISGLGLVVSLTGARIHAVNMLLVMVIAYLFHRGLPFRPGKFILLIALILLLPTFLTILREGKGISVERMIEYVGYIANRTFVIPMNLGSWYIHYTQMEGGFGLAGIPKLASLLGIPAVNAANLIGLKYEGGALSSVSAGAGYLFTYYSYFGLFSLVISFFSVWLLDISLVIYGKISDRFLLPCMAAISLSTLSFISSDYTTVWLTHGFGVILVFCLFLDRGIRVAAALNQFLSGFPFPAEQKKAIPL